MSLFAAGIAQVTAGLAWQERCAVPAQAVPALLRRAVSDGAAGAVLLSTCGRTELYLDADAPLDAPALLHGLLGVPDAPLEAWQDEAAARHLHRVACGLCSPIPGDDQIGGQVRLAMEAAQDAGTLTPDLSVLFRSAVSAAKKSRAACPVAAPRSAAAAAVREAEIFYGKLKGRRAVVIGGGEMGRLAAGLLAAAGATVTVTLRTYRHGETVVPAGCTAVPFDRRAQAIEGADLLLSATRSPHQTWTCAQQAALAHPPALLFDLALPRDLEPALADMAALYDLERLQMEPPDLSAAEAVVEEKLAALRGWRNYRASLPRRSALEDAILQRVLSALPDTPEAAATAAVEKAVALLTAEFREELTPERLERCIERIRSHTR